MKDTTAKPKKSADRPLNRCQTHSRHAGEHHAGVGLGSAQETLGVGLSEKVMI